MYNKLKVGDSVKLSIKFKRDCCKKQATSVAHRTLLTQLKDARGTVTFVSNSNNLINVLWDIDSYYCSFYDHSLEKIEK